MFIYNQWESFCKKLDNAGINSITAASLMDKKSDEFFLVLKHDVETDPSKALKLAKIENRYNHKGSYYVQGYLLKNKKNISILKEIQKLGHEVSYHHDVMDSNKGDLNGAKKEFEDYIKLFKDNEFVIKTVCQHGNPIVERSGYNSNRDFFRDLGIKNYFKDITEIMVSFKEKTKTDYKYISDAGYGWKVIYDPENNDVIDSSSKDIALNDLEGVLKYIQSNENIILSTHPHRWNGSLFMAKAKSLLFGIIKRVAKMLFRIPLFKKVMSRYYYLAKKI
jgi:hypothetical protein